MLHQYKGSLHFINSKNLSKYASRKLGLSGRFGFVQKLETLPYGKVKVNVFYFDMPFANAWVNYVSTEIVEDSDIIELNWTSVLDLYRNHNMRYVISNYLRYIELYVVNCDKTNHYVYDLKSESDKPVLTLKTENCYTTHDKISEWMIQQVESGAVNIDEVIKDTDETIRKHSRMSWLGYEYFDDEW